jgi:hypothetical protein
VLVLVVLAACGGDDASREGRARVLSVAEALDRRPPGTIAVRGYVLVDPDGTARLCEGLAGSYPPQCGGARLRVDGLAPDTLHGRSESGGVVWTGATTLRGTLDADRLVLG